MHETKLSKGEGYASACVRRHHAFTLTPVRDGERERQRDAAVCIRRHQAFALSP